MHRHRSWPLAVLDDDRRALGELVGRAADGSSECVVVSGEGGGGKSHVLAETAAAAEQFGMQVLSRHGRSASGAPGDVADRLAREAGRLLGEPAAGRAPGRLEDALHRLLEDGPLAVLIDDCDCADDASLATLAEVVDGVDGPILWVVSLRSQTDRRSAALIGAMMQNRDALSLRMLALQRPDVAAALELSGLGEPDPAFAKACTALTGGNPGYLNDLLGELHWLDLTPVQDSLEALDRVLPASTVRTLHDRMGRFGVATAAVADAVYILEEDATKDRVGRLADVDLDELPEQIDHLTASAVLAPGVLPRLRCPLVARALTNAPASRARAAMHGRAAALLRAEGLPLEQVVGRLHRSEPGTAAGGAEALLASARLEVEAGRLAAAERHLQRLTAEPGLPASMDGGEQLLTCIQVALDRPGATERFDARVEQVIAPADRADSLRDLGDVLRLVGRPRSAAAAYERALAELAASPPGDQHAELESRLVWTGLQLPFQRPRIRAMVDSRDVAEWTRRDPLSLSVLAVQEGRPRTEALALLDVHRTGGDPSELHQPEATGLRIAVLIWSDELVAARRACTRHLAGAPTHSLPATWVLCQLAMLDYVEGDLASAIERADTVAQRAASLAPHPLMAMATTVAALAELELHGPVAAAARLEPQVSDTEAQAWDAIALGARGWIELGLGDAAAGLGWFEASERLALAVGIHNPAIVGSMLGSVYALRRVGRTAEARRRAATALGSARTFAGPRTLSAALRASAACAPRDRAIKFLAEAVEVTEGSTATLERIRALLMYGVFLGRDNRREAARKPLGEALDLASRTQAKSLTERARSELRVVGARPRRELLSGVESLTVAERQVAEQVASGLTNNAVAAALVVTPKTVEWHLRNVYSKLGIKGRGSLAAALEGADATRPARAPRSAAQILPTHR